MIKKQDQLKQLDEASNIPKYKIYLNIIGLGNVPKPIRTVQKYYPGTCSL